MPEQNRKSIVEPPRVTLAFLKKYQQDLQVQLTEHHAEPKDSKHYQHQKQH